MWGVILRAEALRKTRLLSWCQTMRSLFSSLRSIAPFLFGERPALALTRSLREVQTSPTADSRFSDGARQSGLRIKGLHENVILNGVHIAECELSDAHLKALTLVGGHLSRSHLRSCLIDGCEAEGSTWNILDLEGADIKKLRATSSHLSLLSLRDASLSESSLADSSMTLCDLSGARLTQVDLSATKLEGCDFTGSVLVGVNLCGADLRSSLFTEAWFADVNLEGALVHGADFRRVGGLTAGQLTLLRQGGARVSGGRLYGLWSGLIGGKGGPAPHRRVLRAVAITWATLALLVPSLFFLRAILDPVDPESPPSYETE